MKLLEEKLDLKTITVMVQKEVTDRLTALPGTKNQEQSHTVYIIMQKQKKY